MPPPRRRRHSRPHHSGRSGREERNPHGSNCHARTRRPCGLRSCGQPRTSRGNLTGMSWMLPELAVKRLGLLKEAVPGISRVLVLSYLDDPIALLQLKALKDAARSLGVVLQIHNIRSGDDLPAAFDAGLKERAEGLLTTAESMFFVHRARVTELAARYRLPAIYPFSMLADEAGGLMAYYANIPDHYRRAATYVDRILKGAKPSDLPIQQPTKLEFVINLKTAKALGLTFPPGLLAIADRVIE